MVYEHLQANGGEQDPISFVDNLFQKQDEPAIAYYKRTLHLLNDAGGKDKKDSTTVLSPLGKTALFRMRKAFGEGIYDPVLRKQVIILTKMTEGYD